MMTTTDDTTTNNDDGNADIDGGGANDGAGDEQLGAGGMKALDAERKARREAEQRATTAQAELDDLKAEQTRSKVADAHGLSAEQAKFLTGSDENELNTAARDLLAAFPTSTGSSDSSTSDSAGDTPGPRRPAERLTPGNSSADDDASDTRTVADRVMRSGW